MSEVPLRTSSTSVQGCASVFPGAPSDKMVASSARQPPMFLKRLRLTLDMIKFEHSVFALPFALTGALLAYRESGFQAQNTGSYFVARTVLWIVVAMVGARSAAMAFNRLVDAEIDARNPRTKIRHIPAGLLTRPFCWGFTVGASALFLLAAWELNPL